MTVNISDDTDEAIEVEVAGDTDDGYEFEDYPVADSEEGS